MEGLVALEEVVVGRGIGAPDGRVEPVARLSIRLDLMGLSDLRPVDDVRLKSFSVDAIDNVLGLSAQLRLLSPRTLSIRPGGGSRQTFAYATSRTSKGGARIAPA